MSAPENNKYASFSNTNRFINPPEKSHRRDWVKNDLRSFRGKKTLIRYNQLRMLNQSQILTKDQWNEVGSIYRPDSKTPEYTVKRFINNEQVTKVADEQLAKILTDNGITLDFLIKEKKDLIGLSKENKQLNVTLKTIESFENNLGLNQKVTVSETRQYNADLNNINEVIDKAEADKRKVTVSTTVIKPIENVDNEAETRQNISGDSKNEQKTEDQQ